MKPCEGDAALTRKLIDRVWALNEQIGIPRTLDVIREEDTEALLGMIIPEGGNYPSPRFLSREEIAGILQAIRG